MSYHDEELGLNNHALTANPNATGAPYADIAARNADVAFSTNIKNVNKLVRVDSPLSYYMLTSITPTWLEFSSTSGDEFTELLDTPSTISPNLILQGNAAGTALEFGQDLRTTANPTFANLTLSALNMSSQLINSVLDPVSAQDAATKNYVDTHSLIVTKVGTPINNQLAVWTGDGTLEGTSALTYDGDTLNISTGRVASTRSGFGNNSAFFVDSPLPSYGFRNSAESNNARIWDIAIIGRDFKIRTFDDLHIGFADAMTITRSNNPNILSIAFNTPLLSTSGDLVVTGNLTVNGTTTTINSTTLQVDDKNIELGTVTTPSDITADGGGITLKGLTDKTIIWDNPNDNWSFNQSVNISTGLDYKINNVSVLNATTLGVSVIASSLTSVGTITNLIASAFQVTGTLKDTSGDVGTIGQILSSTVTGTNWINAIGDILKVGTPVNNQIGVWTGDGTLEGTTGIVFDDTTKALRIGVVPGTITNDSNIELVKNTASGASDVMQRWTWQPGGTIWGLRLDQEFNVANSRIQYNFIMRNGLSTDVDMMSFAGGNVGFGTKLPTAKIHVIGTSKFTAAMDMSSQLINNILNPVSAQDAATKSYVDGQGFGNVFKVGTPVDNQVAIWTGDGTVEGVSGLTFDGSILTANELVVIGNLTVNGTVTTINSVTVTVDDKNIELGSVATPTDLTADGGGITLKGLTDKTINWLNATDRWTFNQGIEITPGNSLFTGGISSIASLLLNPTLSLRLEPAVGATVIVGSLELIGQFRDGDDQPGTSGQILSSTGTLTSWIDPSTADVVKVGTPVDNQVGVWTGDGTLEGTTNLIFDTSGPVKTLSVIAGGAGEFAKIVIDGFLLPIFEMREGDASANNRRWDTVVDTNVMFHRVLNDAGVQVPYQTITRNLNTITSIEFTTNLLSVTGTLQAINDLVVGNDLVVDTDTLIVESATNRVKIGDVASGLTDLTIFQSSGNFKGLTLSGVGVTGSSTTEGVSLLVGNNDSGNTQLWIVNKVDQGNASKNSFRFITGSDCPLIIGVNNIGTLNRNLCFGVNGPGGNCGFGFPTTAVQANIQARIHVQEILDTTAVVITETTNTNPGITKKFVGDRDPNANITGSGGDEYYRDSGETSGSFESLETTTGTAWNKRAINPPNTIQILNSAQFDALASGGVVTISVNTTLHINGSITTSNRIVVNSGITLHITAMSFGSKSIVYIGTGTFLTTAGGTIRIRNGPSVVSASTGTFMSFSGTGTFSLGDLGIVGWDNLGTFADGFFIHNNVGYINVDSGWTITDAGVIRVDNTTQLGTVMNDSFFTINSKNIVSPYTFNNLAAANLGAVNSSALFNLNGRISNTAQISISGSGVATGKLFLSSALANATITSVADSSPAQGTNTLRVDNGSGGTKHSSTTTYFEDEEVVLAGDVGKFAGTFQIFNVVSGVSFDTVSPFFISSVSTSVAAGGSGYTVNDTITLVGGTFTTAATFNVDSVSAGVVLVVTLINSGNYSVKPGDPISTTGGTGTGLTLNGQWDDSQVGTINSTRINMTLAGGHSIVASNQLKVIQTNFYNGFRIALNVAGDILTVNDIFRGTDTGNIKRGFSLDETDPRVSARNNFGFQNSETLAFGFTNNNVTTTTITDGTYAVINASGFVTNPNTERFKFNNATTALFELTSIENFSGFLTGSLSAVKSGSTASYRFAMSTNGAVPVFATANHIPMEVKTTIVNIALEFEVNLSKGDTIQIMVAGDGTGDALTITDLVFGIK